ncbi:RNA ligase family protein [Yinghuangia sp. YIM S09857]|uniref:RNA ligase family protein n=1 Tax=Yinghuangia sp. YIM S09857 TaxID=3436929 RepID=UPI003F534F9B
MRVHYPRTAHLPWSPGAAADDVRSGDVSGLVGREVVVTEKLDGENTTLYADGMHARSLDSGHHPSRAWIKGLHGRVGPGIPDGWRVCGENLYARHSIAYDDLESWFYGFSVWAGDECLDWDRTARFLARLGVPAPPVLWRGVFDERALRALRLDLTRQEGYVVRTVEGFPREEFGARVAKWVRPRHVQTDTHWMYAAVVENGLGPAAALWNVRSGAAADIPALLAAVGLPADTPYPAKYGPPPADIEDVVADAAARLDVLGRTGNARLAGVLAALLYDSRRAWLAPRLAEALGMPLARRIADLVGLHTAPHRPYPDDERRTGLVRLAQAADLGILHAVSHAVLAGRRDQDAADAREQIEWSALHAEDAGLMGPAPLEGFRTGLRSALGSGLPEHAGIRPTVAAAGPLGMPDHDAAADRCWAEARELYAKGRISTPEEAVAATWRWRTGEFPRLVHMVGPSGSGKSSFAEAHAAGLRAAGQDVALISLDDLRESRGARSEQRDNNEVLRIALDRLDQALASGGTAVWDATSLNAQQRSLVHAVARRRDALTTHAVVLVDDAELLRRNARREHPVPHAVLDGQVQRFVPPYPGQAHRTWYVDGNGSVGDVHGSAAPGPAEGLLGGAAAEA